MKKNHRGHRVGTEGAENNKIASNFFFLCVLCVLLSAPSAVIFSVEGKTGIGNLTPSRITGNTT
jgi:hypothetical protein